MSLKWFHVFFIGTAVALSLVLAIWAVQNSQWWLALSALATGAALVVYRGVFLRKVRELP
jgi:hypothetical protein